MVCPKILRFLAIQMHKSHNVLLILSACKEVFNTQTHERCTKCIPLVFRYARTCRIMDCHTLSNSPRLCQMIDKDHSHDVNVLPISVLWIHLWRHHKTINHWFMEQSTWMKQFFIDVSWKA